MIIAQFCHFKGKRLHLRCLFCSTNWSCNFYVRKQWVRRSRFYGENRWGKVWPGINQLNKTDSCSIKLWMATTHFWSCGIGICSVELVRCRPVMLFRQGGMSAIAISTTQTARSLQLMTDDRKIVIWQVGKVLAMLADLLFLQFMSGKMQICATQFTSPA